MKALIRKYPENARTEQEAEVFIQTAWLDWMDQTTGAPLTAENYHYAICEDVPDDCAPTAIPTDFDVTEHTTEVPSEDPEGQPTTVRSWTAVFVRDRWDARPKEEQA